MAKLNVIKLNETVIRTEEGSVDVNRTMDKLESMVREWVKVRAPKAKAKSKVNESVFDVGSAVHVVFDKYLGRAIKMDDVRRLVTANLKVEIDDLSTVAEIVGNYIRNNSEFTVMRGRNGGVSRNCDKVAK